MGAIKLFDVCEGTTLKLDLGSGRGRINVQLNSHLYWLKANLVKFLSSKKHGDIHSKYTPLMDHETLTILERTYSSTSLWMRL